MPTFIKYALFFAGVFVVFLLIGAFAFFHTMGGSAGVVGWWINYDEDLGQITAFQSKIAFYRGQQPFVAEGTWKDKVFYPVSSVGSDDAVIARILPNEDLELHLDKFEPAQSGIVTAVKFHRMPTEFHPYPVAVPGEHVAYPPPKGMIKPGMLEADLDDLPWQPSVREEPLPMDPWHPMENNFGTKIMNGWPRTWHYKSDNPNLPELRVQVERGRVTQVTGGAEDTDEVDYAPRIPPPDSDESVSPTSAVIHWLIGIFLGR